MPAGIGGDHAYAAGPLSRQSTECEIMIARAIPSCNEDTARTCRSRQVGRGALRVEAIVIDLDRPSVRAHPSAGARAKTEDVRLQCLRVGARVAQAGL